MTPTPYHRHPATPAVHTAHTPAVHNPAPPVYYTHTTMTGELVTLTAADIAARRHTDRVLHARWIARQAEQRERDRRARRFWAGLGATLGVGVLAGCGIAGWLLVNATGSALILAVLALAVLAVGVPVGHKCITIVQHRH